jgi:nucleoside-diphosphate-sugar epimerase
LKFSVLGATGLVGANLVRKLTALDHDVYAPPRGDASVFQRPLGHVIYCIGLTADFRSRPFDTVRAHVGVLAELLERAAFDSFLYLSSTRVYSGAEIGDEKTLVKVSSEDPSDLYNLSKLMGESLCLNCGKENVRAVRLSNVIGYASASANFVFDIASDALRGHIRLRSHPSSAKDYVAIDDVVDLLPKIAAGGKHRLYNLASGVKLSHRELVERLSELTGCTWDQTDDAPVLGFPDINISRTRDEFGFAPRSVLDYLPGILSKLKLENR